MDVDQDAAQKSAPSTAFQSVSRFLNPVFLCCLTAIGLSVFAKHRIEKIEPEFGEKFDPQMHQAMFEAPVPGAPAGTVIQVMNVGFTIADRLLRPAQVGVSSNPG